MTTPALSPQGLAELRLRAASRLTGLPGAPVAQGPFDASRALAVLHDLASSPDTAADALAMLHELQVHQVELELQTEAANEIRAELEATLRHQVALYDALPVGCLTIDAALVVHALNRTAAVLLGIGQDAACGRPLSDFLTPECQRALAAATVAAAAGRPGAVPTLHLMPEGGGERRVSARVGAAPQAPLVLLVLSEAGDPSPGSIA